MTIYNYNYNQQSLKDIKQTVSIAAEIATREQFETDCHRLVPMDTKVIFLKADTNKIFLKDGNRCDYDYVRGLLWKKGYGKSWVLHSVWLVEEDDEF